MPKHTWGLCQVSFDFPEVKLNT
uniref:Uncharacterized protein n=1 Tax=Anguilla anguilla TaxID=7936 RepID=A0A0E9UG73_ANGAN